MQSTHSYQQEQAAFLQLRTKPSYITWRHNVMEETVTIDNAQKLREKILSDTISCFGRETPRNCCLDLCISTKLENKILFKQL